MVSNVLKLYNDLKKSQRTELTVFELKYSLVLFRSLDTKKFSIVLL